jgi:hypothetical protein
MNRIMVLHGSCRRDPRSDREPLPLAAIPYAKRLELQVRSREAQYASMAGLALAVAGLGAMSGHIVTIGELEFPLDGKPRVAHGPDFSIAHTDGWVGCAVASRDAIGFDVEALSARASGASLERWTAVEAVLKAAGAGLRRAHEVDIDLAARRGHFAGADYFLHPLALAPDLVAHVATGAPESSIVVREIRIDEALAHAMREPTQVPGDVSGSSIATDAADHVTAWTAGDE